MIGRTQRQADGRLRQHQRQIVGFGRSRRDPQDRSGERREEPHQFSVKVAPPPTPTAVLVAAAVTFMRTTPFGRV